MSLSKINDGHCLENIECNFGAICINISSIKSKCICDIDCNSVDTLGQHQSNNTTLNNSESSSIEQLNNLNQSINFVCGDDEITYPSECALKSYACRMQKSIHIKYFGKCDKKRKKSSSTSSSTSSSSSSSPSSSSPTSTPETLSTSIRLSSETVMITFPPIKRSTIIKTIQQQDSNQSTPSSWPNKNVDYNSTLIAPTNATLIDSNIGYRKIVKIAGFLGNSTIEMPPLQAYNRLSIELDFMTHSENGLILYNGQANNGDGDFVSLSIKAGKVPFVEPLFSSSSSSSSSLQQSSCVYNNCLDKSNFIWLIVLHS